LYLSEFFAVRSQKPEARKPEARSGFLTSGPLASGPLASGDLRRYEKASEAIGEVLKPCSHSSPENPEKDRK